MRIVDGVSRNNLESAVTNKDGSLVFAMESSDFLFIKRKNEISITQGSRSVIMTIEEWKRLVRDMRGFLGISEGLGNDEIE